MKAALHLHLYYPELAAELVGRAALLVAADPALAVHVTHAAPLHPAIADALAVLPQTVVTATPNVGWDLGPLFHILPRLIADGVEAVAHLHTKRGESGYAPEWRALGLEGTVASPDLVARIVAAFAGDDGLMLAGPAALYKSAASHQFGNGAIVAGLAPAVAAPAYPPADWGFFAGSFLWARTALLERLAALARFDGGEARDGTVAHALERLIGLAPVACGGRIALVDEAGGIAVVTAPAAPSREPIVHTLVARAERNVGPLDEALAASIAARNPLADYLRHGRDADALDPNPYFSSGFYNRIHDDVFAAGAHPFVHYVRHGATEGRAAGPLFDGAFYRRSYPDVTGDPLTHYLATGAGEGRVAIPISRPEHDPERDGAAERPRRFYRAFDIARETAFLARMAALPPADARVSVVMPVWNRVATVGNAIRSVLAQGHRAWELIVVDDGSDDGTADAVRPFLADPRVRLIEAPHGGVSAARNRALAEASGAYVAYLDSDNRWVPWFLEVMLRFIAEDGLAAAYAGIALRDDLGQLTGYRGDAFDRDACLEQNYVDLNSFVHARELLDATGGFDETLRRMVDWDLILRLTKDRATGYAPFVGCDYHDGTALPGRITTTEPVAFQTLVRTRNRLGLATGTTAFAQAVQLSFAIKIAALEEEREAWGDWHFAEALAAAIRRLGHVAHVDFRGAWSGRSSADEDVAIVLRGLVPYVPPAGRIACLWTISHPDQVPFEEYDRFNRVYVAGESHAAMLAHMIRPPASALPQATAFRPQRTGGGPDVLFVGNSRGVERDIVTWAIAAGRPPEIHGGGWEGLAPAGLVRSANVANAELPARYASAGVVLNDHWPAMRAHGYVSNRLFDVVASGGRAISDPVPSLDRLIRYNVTQVNGPAELREAVDKDIQAPVDMAYATEIADVHSFDERAKIIVGDVFELLGLERIEALKPLPFGSGRWVGVGSLHERGVSGEAPPPPPPLQGRGDTPAIHSPPAPIRVHAIVPFAPHGPQSSAYIRLVAPLTDETVAGRVHLTLGRAEEDLPRCDVAIVQRMALPDFAAVDRLVGRLGAMGAALVTDVDDGFAAIPADHPEADVYRPLNAVLERAIAASAESWFSTEPLARLYAAIAGRRFILPNAIDPRLWRDWRHPRPAPLAGGPVRFLYMGTHTHGADLPLAVTALERVHAERPDSFDLTLVGVAHDLPPEIARQPWLRRLAVPADAVPYPRFVRWLRAQGPFDVGLAPLDISRFNDAKSDIKLLDYAALGLAAVVNAGAAYSADVGMAALAVHCASHPHLWYEALDAIVADPAPARARAIALHERLWARRTVAGIAPGMIERLAALA